ncbi:carbonic anhydrase [Solitalea sp. MAHUQ-68]|uniref:Carbonic anhydrase n=1 Tax=Solitalea agri TaxID=2953739 RepID=A0A9X2F5C8_9SPHI|nr:carbonic anhydrase [Solitalea agri]MCO4294425.1 carbonic anhydrase [Solitalea agri]
MKKILSFAALIVLFNSCQHATENNGDMNLSALNKLKAGNERFAEDSPVHPDETLKRKQELKKEQHPFAVVVSCSDSRVPPELIFDQGLGDLFIIRTAGNVIGTYEVGSIEYAVEHLHCKLVIVLGHQSCGAVKAFLESKGEKHQDHIQSIVDYIGSEQEVTSIVDSLKKNPLLAVKLNVKHGVKLLKNSTPVLKPLVDKAELNIIGAYYNLDNGKVSFEE